MHIFRDTFTVVDYHKFFKWSLVSVVSPRIPYFTHLSHPSPHLLLLVYFPLSPFITGYSIFPSLEDLLLYHPLLDT